MVELGRIEIVTEVSILSSHNTYLHEGHILSALHIISYLKGRNNSRMALDRTYPEIVYEKSETEKDWTAFYGNVKEVIPTNAPTHLGKSVDLHMMVDIDHPVDNTTRRSRTGFMIFVNLYLITWISKKHPTAE